ncbi:MAG: TRAP transporter small permease subunit [Polyangiaceae bacterium]|nr:TRAP transporter small permease subunit [Polyangiaceae bacterium]
MAKKSRKKASGRRDETKAQGPKEATGKVTSGKESDPEETSDEVSGEANEEGDSDESDDESPDAALDSKSETDSKSQTTSKSQSDSGSEDDSTSEDDSEDEPSESQPPAKSAGGSGDGGGEEPKPAAWGRPLMRLDQFWTRFEMRLCALVLALEVFSLSLWVVLKGMSARADSGSNAGIVFRAVIGAVFLGSLGYWALKKQPMMVRRLVAIAGVAIGLFGAKAWANWGVEYSSNLLNWYQQASSLTLLGGLRGIGTRLTLLLALLGGSLATGAGKHITIDVVTRMVKPVVRKWMVLVGWVATAAICFVASWGFFDHVAIESFGAKNDDPAGKKISTSFEALGENFFIARKQLGLDFKTLPHVLKGENYSRYLSGKEWNEWLQDSGMAEHYGEEAIAGIRVPDDATRAPIVVIPGKGEPRGELISTANLVFPIGLFIISLRFILLTLLVLSGHRTTEPEEDATFASDQPSGGDPPPDPDPPGTKDEAPEDDEEKPSAADPDDSESNETSEEEASEAADSEGSEDDNADEDDDAKTSDAKASASKQEAA